MIALNGVKRQVFSGFAIWCIIVLRAKLVLIINKNYHGTKFKRQNYSAQRVFA